MVEVNSLLRAEEFGLFSFCSYSLKRRRKLRLRAVEWSRHSKGSKLNIYWELETHSRETSFFTAKSLQMCRGCLPFPWGDIVALRLLWGRGRPR